MCPHGNGATRKAKWQKRVPSLAVKWGTPPTRLGRYEILERVGSGGMGEVFRARDGETGEIVAVKLLLDARNVRSSERMRREAMALAGIVHPGVVRFRDVGEEDGQLFLCMEWVEGETLRERLGRGLLHVGEAVAVGAGVAEALAAVHARGILHRDLKPENLLLERGDVARPRLIDFGVARLEGVAGLTGTGVLIGTPVYMAPEQARGQRDVGPAVDLFALGAVLYECAAGVCPFTGETAIAVLAKVLLHDPPRPSRVRRGVPPALDDVIMALLAKDPRRRPSDAAQVGLALRAIESASPGRGSGRPFLTSRELVPSTIVAVGSDPRAAAGETIAADDAPVAPAIDAVRAAAVQARARHGGRYEALADGSALLVFDREGDLEGQARLAARAALALSR